MGDSSDTSANYKLLLTIIFNKKCYSAVTRIVLHYIFQQVSLIPRCYLNTFVQSPSI